MTLRKMGLSAGLMGLVLMGCGGQEGVVPSLTSPTLQGASASGGDERVKFPAFEFKCELVYTDQKTGDTTPASFTIDEKNYGDNRETADYVLAFRPAWRDYPTPGFTFDIHLAVKAPGGTLTQNNSRASARYNLDQKQISLWIYNDHTEAGEAKSHRRSVTLDCDRSI